MRKRRLMLLVELESTTKIVDLVHRIKSHLELWRGNKVLQVQANVVQKKK